MIRNLTLACAALFALGFAFPASAQSRAGEMRGAWMGDGYGRDWPTIMKSLKDSGFNALFPNLCIGAMAYYPSKVMIPAPGGTPGRDELAEAAKAAKANGIELHLWRINWALWGVPKETLDKLEAEGRLQRNAQGKLGRDDPDVTTDWLCPSHPENRKLEKEAMLEAIRNYDLAGIQFDYMRFPNGNYCYCDHCKAQFQQDAKVTVSRWPEDVQDGGPFVEQWRAWRRGLITSLATEISEECHRIKPNIFVSLASWPNLDDAYSQVAQDWTAWVKDGILDFVCPMDYTDSKESLVKDYLPGQLDRVRGTIPVYPGLGAFLMKSSYQFSDQIEATRDLGADGFLAFAYGSGDFDKWLPDLHASVTAGDPNPMPHWAPLTRFAFKGPAIIGDDKDSTTLRTVTAGARFEVSMAIGIALVRPSSDERAGAEQAAAVLRQAANQRLPGSTFDPAATSALPVEQGPRISGRVVAERPDGDAISVLGAFDGEMGIPSTFRAFAPEGPFRIAIYGTAPFAGGTRSFVSRSVLLTGVKPAPPAPAAP